MVNGVRQFKLVTCMCCILQKAKLASWQSNRITATRIPPPRNRFMLLCYHMCMHGAFDIFMYVVIMLNVIAIIVEFSDDPDSHTEEEARSKELMFFIFNIIFIVIYIFEAVIKVRDSNVLYCTN